jgi:iron complex outermembrane recepter protein
MIRLRFSRHASDFGVFLRALHYSGFARSLAGTLALTVAALSVNAAEVRELANLSLEQLSKIEVTSVSRRAEPVSTAASSVFVITGEDIRRSGASNLPDALRLAPNLQVARINNRLYAITARGFNSNIANKLLVMVDGRTIYSPLFSGVFWDAQDLVLEDIDRIEVIDGPGAATWGANAVSGVINVITRSAADTVGWMVGAGVGNQERLSTVQYGASFGEHAHFRVYGRGSQLDNTSLQAGGSALDGWDRAQAGFRADWSQSRDALTLQGDVYDESSDDRPVLGEIEVSGFNLLGSWRRAGEDGSFIDVRAYYDSTDRVDLRLLQETARIFDIDLKRGLSFDRHSLVVGGGYRYARSESDPGTLFAFVPANQDLSWYNIFGQDQIRLSDTWELTLGLRLEHNEYTQWETLPNVRLAWKPDDEQLYWAAVSRAVRSPARLDREIHAPPAEPFFIRGGPDFVSEVADVFELGYRASPSERTSFSITAWQHRYDRLRSGQLVPGVGLFIANYIEGDVSGVTAWGSWQAAPRWRLSAGGMILDKDLRLKPGSTDPIGPQNLGDDPDYQLMLRSTFDISSDWQFDAMLRHVAELPAPAVPSYTALDVRVGWRPTAHWDVSLTLQDLLDSEHVEFDDFAERSTFEPTGILRVVWKP